MGLKHGSYEDRTFVVLDKETGIFVSARPRPNDNPKLILVQVTINDANMATISAKGTRNSVALDLEKVIQEGNVLEVK